MKNVLAISLLAAASSVMASPAVEKRATSTTSASGVEITSTVSPSASASPANYGNYGAYGAYGAYGSYGAYSRSTEEEADIEALLALVNAIKGKRAATAEAIKREAEAEDIAAAE